MKYLLSLPSFKAATSVLVCCVFVVQLTACGTIMFPERRGQSGDFSQLDIKVVSMDGALLFLFILPGLIAYAVDFATGCIYLPPDRRLMQNMDGLAPEDMQVIRIAPERLNLDTLPGIIEQYTGLSIASKADQMHIFRPDSADIDIQRELALMLDGQTPQSQGTWYTGEQVTLIADTDGRVTSVGLVVPVEARLVEE